MSEGEVDRKWSLGLVVALTTVVAFPAGVFAGRIAPAELASTTTSAVEAKAAKADATTPVDDAVAAAEARVKALEGNYDEAMSDLYSPEPIAPVDREAQMAERQAIEVNEMICQETGQNCELARMARRHYNERYGSGS